MEKDEEFAFSNLDLAGSTLEAQRETIRFAFTFPELLQRFREVDRQALRTKDISRRIGYTAIASVFVAMILASSSGLWALDENGERGLGLVSAMLGILGTALGIWNLAPFSQRRHWLLKRMQAECLRNFHFAYIAENAGQIIAASGNPALEKDFQTKRFQTFEILCARLFNQKAKPFTRLIRFNENVLDGLIEAGSSEVPVNSHASNDLFVAWRQLRLQWQLNYCQAKLSNASPGGQATPRRTELIFTALAWMSVILVLGLHIIHFTENWVPISKTIADFAIVAIALFALATRAVESGLATEGEVERYEQYRARLKVSARRFDKAETVASKIEIMQASEETSVEEMVAFLKTQNRSQFLL